MSTLSRILILFVALQGLHSTIVWACSCAPPDTPAVEMAEADMVFVGEVVLRGCGYGAIRSPGVVRVTEAFKGVEGGDYVQTKFWTGGGGSCGVSVEPRESWLLFLDEDYRTVNLCSPSQPISSAADEIAALRALTSAD